MMRGLKQDPSIVRASQSNCGKCSSLCWSRLQEATLVAHTKVLFRQRCHDAAGAWSGAVHHSRRICYHVKYLVNDKPPSH